MNVAGEKIAMKKYSICFAADKKYAKYCYVAVFSALRNIDPNFSCDIVVLTTPDVPEEFAGIFSAMSTDRVSVRTLPVEHQIAKFGLDRLFTSRYLTYATYLRLLIPDLFAENESVLYLDGDIIVFGDVSELLSLDLGGGTIGCCLDVDRHRMDSERVVFIENELKIPRGDYFNAGVLLYSIPACLEFGLLNKALDFFERVPEPPFHDQDALNSILHGTTVQIPPEWNIMSYFVGKKRLSEVMDSHPELLKSYLPYIKAMWHPKLVHFPGSRKPWFAPYIHYADHWWQYAKQTPLYEKFFQRKMHPQVLEYS